MSKTKPFSENSIVAIYMPDICHVQLHPLQAQAPCVGVLGYEARLHKRYLLAIEFLILWWSSVAYAADIDFQANISAGYDSNVSRSATAPREDTYFTLAPKLSLELPFNKAYFSSSSRVALEQHVNQTDANLQELVFSGLGRYNPSDYLSFGLRDGLIISGRSKSAEELTDVTRKREFVDNRLLSSFKYELRAGTLASLEYVNVIRDYRDTEKDDWIKHIGQLQVEYSLGYKTLTQVGFGLIKKGYEADVDYISVPVTALFRRKVSSKFDASFSLGLESRRYNEAHQDRNWDKPTASINITGKFTPKTNSRLLLQRKVYDSDAATGYVFVSTAGDVALVLNLSDAAQLILKGLYSRNAYIRIERTDNVFEGCGAIQYSLSKWGAVVLGYGYEQRTSSVPDSDYKQHTVDLYYTTFGASTLTQ